MKKIFLLLMLALILFTTTFVSAETGFVAYQTNLTATIPQYQMSNGTFFSVNETATNILGIAQWLITKHNPIRNETIVATLDNNSDVKVQFYNGSWKGTYNLTLTSGVISYRSFDIEIEQSSGDVMAVYNNGTAGNLTYQVWNGTDWYKNGTINLNISTSSQVNWVELASNPAGNQIMLVAQTATPQITAHYWNGTDWATSYRLETFPEIATKGDFNLAFENSGDALIAWANASSVYPRYITFSNNTWGTIGNAPASSGQTADFQWIRMANYPGTDRIMLCSADAGADFNCVEWTGNGWGSVFEITATGEYLSGTSFRNFDITPEISSGSFFFIYGASNIDYYYTRRCFGISNCQTGNWEAAQTFLSVGDIGADTGWAQLSYDPINQGKITAVMTDQNVTNQTIAVISCSNSPNSCATILNPFTLANSSVANSRLTTMFTYQAMKPSLSNITMNSTIGASLQTGVLGNGLSDLNSNILYFYCSYSSNQPTSSNTVCSEGNSPINPAYPSSVNCTFTSQSSSGNYILYCRTYDGFYYSNTANASYTVSSNAPTTSIISVAGDTAASYFDTINDLRTDILISGVANMLCRWSSSDDAYSSMSKTCSVSGTTANCSVDDVLSQALVTRYVSCADSLGNGQNSSNNLNVQFYLDYAAPTTSDNSDLDIHATPYTVTITEGDAVDGNPTTKYCTSSSQECNPTTSIDSGGQITYSSSNRGANYLRYYSTDFAGNVQTVVNKTISINQLPTFTTAIDNAIVIKGGVTINVSTNSSDSDLSQTISLFVCNSSGANSSGCLGGQYCNTTGTANLSCSFASESDSASHTWYAYLFDDLGEGASNNPLTGSYTTDTTAPTITLNNPSNGSTITQNSVTITITVNEPSTNSWYSLNGNANVSMSNTSLYLYIHSNTSIADGNYNLSIWANDSYGNFGGFFGNSFTINTATAGDTTSPVITIISPENATYNNPNSLLINITANENLNWAGYKLNSGSINNLTNTSGTNWNITLIGLSQETTYNLTIFANDTSNNPANKSIIFYTDSLSPRYSSASAVPSPANVSQAVNCSINWTDGFNINSVIIGENSAGVFENHTISFSGASGSASYNIIGNKLTNRGTYTCQFFATDAAGNYNSTSVNFSINDVTAPIITVTSPSNSTYNQVNIGVSIVVSEAASWAGYSLDGAANATMGNTSSTAWNKTLTGLSEAAHNIIFYANDSSGNMGNSSLISFSVNTGAVDNIFPVITINTLSNSSYYTNTTLTLNITANENCSWAGYIINSGVLFNMSNSSMINWNATLSGLENESTNTLKVYANDTSQNKGNITITFYVDTVAPRFSNFSATPIIANETQNVICNAYINDSFNFGYVKISENSTISGTFLNHTIDLSSAGYANYTILNVRKGNYTCIFYVTDAAGNYNTTSITFKVNDVTAPVISINSPLNQSYSTSSILLSITLDENAINANYSLDGGATNLSLTGSGKLWSKTISLSDGSHAVTFYAFDSSGNLGNNSVAFSTDISIYDTTSPVITIWNPVNNTYYTNGTSLLLNISTDEALSWAGYSNNSNRIYNLGNVSTINWNATITLAEGRHNITFYANDSSVNKNKANKSIIIYVDLNNPSIGSFNCTNPANDSQDVICNASVNDTVGLSYYILRNNATGSWINSSQISLSGTSERLNYTIVAENTTPGSFGAELYLYDLSGRVNMSSYIINVTDDKAPGIYNITYLPNTTLGLDPGVAINVNATIVENYNISSVVLMWMNLSDGAWRSVTMKNNSATVFGSSSNIIYNASFVPGNGTYAFKINATDSNRNQNISANYTIVVENDTSFWNSTTIPDTKSFTVLQTAENNSLGVLYLNNTGDNALNFNITLTSIDLGTRLSINYTLNQTRSYSVSSGEKISLSIEANTTSLAANTYQYNITVSSAAGTVVFSKQLGIQALAQPYLVAAITKYSSSVTKGQTDIELIASISNFGAQDATNVVLTWNLPSGLSLASGSLSRNLGSLPIGSSSTNTITISVASSMVDSVVNIIANATATGDLSASDSREVTIGTPTTVVVTVVSGASGGGGGGAGAIAAIVYSKTIEIVRGERDSFYIEINNTYSNSSLEDLTLNITGFLSQYISISPSKISKLNYGETGKFKVTIKAPAYKNYEEYTLKAIISGYRISKITTIDYTETQNIKLIIQEVSKEKSNLILSEAEKTILEMKNAGFNIQEANKLLEQAKLKLSENKNKEAQVLSESIINLRDKAFSVSDLIEKIGDALKNPRKTNLLTGNIAKDILDENGNSISINSVLSGKVIFSGESAETVLDMSIAAFKRGDFNTAEERAKAAQILLLLERKGNFGLFLYLYWQFILLGFLAFSFVGILSYKTYQKSSITKRIFSIDREEDNIRKLLLSSQKDYFSGKISSREYHGAMSQHQNKLAKIKQERLNLRNKRIKMLKSQKILQDLGIERLQVESEIRKLQEQFYKDKKISEAEYKGEFKILNERLSEIEGERITLELLKEKKYGEIKNGDVKEEVEESIAESKKEMNKPGKIRIIFLEIAEFLKSLFPHVKKDYKKEIILIDNKIMDILKEEASKRNHKKRDKIKSKRDKHEN